MSLTTFTKSPAYSKALRALRKQIELTVLPDYLDAAADERRLRQAQLAPRDLDAILASELAPFIAFTLLKLTRTDAPGDDDGDGRPERTRPGAHDRAITVEELGYDRGFLVVCLVEFALARRGARTLTSHLKAMRIPGADAYAQQLLGFHAEATASKPARTAGKPARAASKPASAPRKPAARKPKPARDGDGTPKRTGKKKPASRTRR